jgi:hypothetical protein
MSKAFPSREHNTVCPATKVYSSEKVAVVGGFDVVECLFLDSNDGKLDEAQLIDRLFGDEIARLFDRALL